MKGKDLQHIVEEDGIFPVEHVLPLAIQIANALQATHERGIVHLDLKPSNLLLRRDGKNVVVSDFGISAALRWKDGELVGGGGGTPYFMAPELHKKGGSGSHGADIWSLGVSLYFLVSGTYPFSFDQKSPDGGGSRSTRGSLQQPPLRFQGFLDHSEAHAGGRS